MGLLRNIKERIQGKVPWGSRRSPLWPKVKAKHLEKYPECAACGGTTKIEVHHKIPFSVDPSLELNPKNLITLCERKKYGINCHLAIGHVGNYRHYNFEVVKDAKDWHEKLLFARIEMKK